MPVSVRTFAYPLEMPDDGCHEGWVYCEVGVIIICRPTD